MLVKYTGTNLYRCRELRLIPGNNDVSENVWNEVKDHPLVKMRVEKAIIIPMPQNRVAKVENAAQENDSQQTASATESDGLVSLKDYPAKEAEGLVAETFDIPTLERWKSEETRKGVIKAIDAQLDSLKIDEEK
ncbi:MAG TPA: hypothetical protein DF383_10545 [Deltaproteobacteria bacterium]|nr:hypothetical protein [Deltaproteobacteria bacterium]